MYFIVAFLLSVTVPYCFAENNTIIPDSITDSITESITESIIKGTTENITESITDGIPQFIPRPRSSSQVIYITMVVDTESLFERYKNPSKDPNKPTGIDDHAFVYLIAQQKYVVANQAKPELHIRAQSGDIIRFMTTSESNGYENSAVLYYISSSDKWTQPQCELDYERPMTFPTTCNFQGEQSHISKFAIVSTSLKKAGLITYDIRFAMYYRYRGKTQLYGFFWFDPKVTVTHN